MRLFCALFGKLSQFWMQSILMLHGSWRTIDAKSWRTILSDKENEIPSDDDDNAHLQRKILEDFGKLDCSENVWMKKQWNNGLTKIRHWNVAKF
ncbi:hypothetical protein AVEN_142859-1 [Araneus ventricosus]|uniref:Uncharacterized protein n=1 Tax=Araneus ventricosus TaxID=182803 RepID=A0A4Y2R9C3_ARAVE|nr:hypothetical protein AVEN_142859-1 [Araneus ventricosus]